MKKDTLLGRIGVHGVLLILVVWSMTPFLWTLQTSIKFTRDVAAREPVLWGYETTANAYNAFWLNDEEINMWGVLAFILFFAVIALMIGYLGRQMERSWPFNLAVVAILAFAVWYFPRVFETSSEYEFFINSLIVTVLTVLISISIGLLAGYGLARYTGVSGAVILIVALAFRALPRSAFVLPYFFAAKELGLLDSRLIIVLSLVAVNQPFTIWMLRSFFMDVPKELEEAAMMDGATRFQAFRRVIVPVMWPGVIATSLFTMLLAYNEFLFVRVLAPTEWTLPVAIVSLTAGESSRTITEAAAASVSITLPIVVVIILFQKHLVKGLGAGAVKG
ncbi:MAG: carbohydrate ABC transporter permease [Actinomycetota bacterium]